MMICEKCEKEMQGSAVRCAHCGHNHVLQRIDAWRERRNHQMSARQRDTQPPAPRVTPPAPVQQARAQAKDSTLIRFPKRPQPAAENPPLPSPTPNIESLPEWRQKLDVRLKQIRDQKAMESEPPTPKPRVEAEMDRNPRISSALNRIQRVNYLQPITPPPRTRFAVAAELTTAEPQLESPVIATPPAHRHAEAAVALAAPKAVPVLESFAEPELAVTETPEDPLAEVLTIPTPKQDEPGPAQGLSILEAASLAKRAAAAVIDAEIIAFSLLPLFAVYFFLGGWVETSAIYVPIAVGAVLVALYFFVTYALAGRTMGMAFMNLHLASQSATTENTPPAGPTTVTFTFQQAALRALGGTLSLLLFPINFICIARSYDRLSLSDLLSGTQVVKIKK